MLVVFLAFILILAMILVKIFIYLKENIMLLGSGNEKVIAILLFLIIELIKSLLSNSWVSFLFSSKETTFIPRKSSSSLIDSIGRESRIAFNNILYGLSIVI